MKIIDCSGHNILTIMFKLIKLQIEMTLLIANQLQHFKATDQRFCKKMGYDDPATVERQFKDIIDYRLDGIDPITLEIDVYSIIN